MQRPGDQKAYQCGPNVAKKNKKTDSVIDFTIEIIMNKSHLMKDALKEISKCKEELRSRLDISKSQITTIPASIKELAANLKELYLYSNKLINLPSKFAIRVDSVGLSCVCDGLCWLRGMLVCCGALGPVRAAMCRDEARVD